MTGSTLKTLEEIVRDLQSRRARQESVLNATVAQLAALSGQLEVARKAEAQADLATSPAPGRR